jgi:mannose-6-phosphate isomerase
MAIERARAQSVPKPWGVADLRPWSRTNVGRGQLVGEIRYERPDGGASDPSLLLKLLFTAQPLSIQVHPGDAHAQSMGLARGKTEAWYILSAAPGAKIALGLKAQLTTRQLREAVADGSIVRHVAWRAVAPGDVVAVPAGTVHAIGAGLVIAEIQQRCDVTFRMFDFGRQRDLHVEQALAVADTRPAETGPKPKRRTDERTLLTSNPHFALERIELAGGSTFSVEAEDETWLLVVSGGGRVGKLDLVVGDAVFAQSDGVDMQAKPGGMTVLMASAVNRMVAKRHLAEPSATDAEGSSKPPIEPTLAGTGGVASAQARSGAQA